MTLREWMNENPRASVTGLRVQVPEHVRRRLGAPVLDLVIAWGRRTPMGPMVTVVDREAWDSGDTDTPHYLTCLTSSDTTDWTIVA